MEMDMKMEVEHATDLLNKKIADGTKFTDADMDELLQRHARFYVANYKGDFSYMLDLQTKRSLSVGQLRGALNCWLADAKRTLAASQPTETFDTEAAIAFFENARKHVRWPKVRLQLEDGSPLIIKAKQSGDIDVLGATEWSERFNALMPHWYGRIASGSLRRGAGWNKVSDLVQEFFADPAKVAAAYGKLTGNCSFCSKTLSTPESLSVGYGPICAGHHGLPWGEVSEDFANV